jgi:hypothetical protein
MIVNAYAAAYNYDVGTSDAPSSLAALAGTIAGKWWSEPTSLWQSLNRTLATYQLHAQKQGGVQSFWDTLDVPSRTSVKAMAFACARSLQDAHRQGADGLRNAGVAAAGAADAIGADNSWGPRVPVEQP